jgi:uncharacterized repeat protein (TIGR01451 family)
MKKAQLLATASLTSLMIIGAMAAPAYAWHPKGVIVKTVQNQTAGTAASDANDIATAVSAAPGDTLVYSITVSNTGAAAANGDDDMAHTTMTDTLPAGIELASNPASRTISENLGTIKPGKNVTKTYAVRVTSTTDGDVITNKACFTGNSLVNDNPQAGCDVAIIKVHVPPVKPPQTPPSTPLPPELPKTGNSAFVAVATALTAMMAGFGLNTLRLKRRA